MAENRMNTTPPQPLWVIMGVSGCGKSYIGEKIAHAFQLPFIEGDNYHPQANIDKMAAGIPLQDEDRQDWLATLALTLKAAHESGSGAVLSCSALKKKYRDVLNISGTLPITFLHLHGSMSDIKTRIEARKNHFMPPALLESQFNTLERPTPPEHFITLNVSATPEDHIQTMRQLHSKISSTNPTVRQ